MYIFNPENDLALANFSPHYTPPASALKMAADLAILPVWYAPNGAKVVAESEANVPFLLERKELFSIDHALISFSDISQFPEEKITPWGWNPMLRKKLTDADVREENLPSMHHLKQLRSHSGRQNAIRILNELKAENHGFCGESHFFETVNDALAYLSSFSGNKVLKMPNSGSGKGLIWVLGEITDKQTDWCRRVIREQGGVVAEPVLNKVLDFAMEFNLSGKKSEFVGYSLFQSAASGAYMGNILMSDKEIEERLSEFADVDRLHRLRHSLSEKLPQQFPHYFGYLGVDMMVCQTERGYQIQPCVEINMRMNMGLVAHTFYHRFVKSGSTGKFVVDFFKKDGDALGFCNGQKTAHPLRVESNRIVEGFLPLTPVAEETNYVVWVMIEK